MSEIQDDKAPLKEADIAFGVFVISKQTEDEKDTLLNFFSFLGTIDTFMVGILLASMTSLSQDEINSVSNGYSLSKSFLECVTAGSILGVIAVVVSSVLYFSLGALNLPNDRDDLLLKWVNMFSFLILMVLIFSLVTLVCILFSLYYLGFLKYPSCNNDPTGWAAAGLIFMIILFIFLAMAGYLHIKMVKHIKGN
jgi:hypothetical protein